MDKIPVSSPMFKRDSFWKVLVDHPLLVQNYSQMYTRVIYVIIEQTITMIQKKDKQLILVQTQRNATLKIDVFYD